MAAVDATACAIEGTVICASRAEGLVARAGSAVRVAASGRGGMARGSAGDAGVDLEPALGAAALGLGGAAFSGFALHRELELYALAGIPNTDVLRIATLVPAQLLNREKDLGTIEPGKFADFILIDGDPTQNISDVRKVVTVVKDGKVYDSKAVYAELGIR